MARLFDKSEIGEIKYLEDYFNYDCTCEVDADNSLIGLYVDGEFTVFAYEMTLDDVPDDQCCRVYINGEYYYFG